MSLHEFPSARAPLSVHEQTFDHGLQVRRPTSAGRLSVGIIVEEAPVVTFCGAHWPFGELAIVGDGELDLYAVGAGTIVWIDVDSELIDGPLRARLSEFGSSTARVLNEERLAELRDLCSTGQARDESLVSALNSALAGADIHTLSKEAARRYEFVREAEEFMWRHAEEQIDLASVAAALGCSVRKLLYYFKRTYGLGPISYFKTQRLNAVRDALQNDRTNRPILDIAADFGFWHMGHFGTDYKALFGVTPSQTRRAAAI